MSQLLVCRNLDSVAISAFMAERASDGEEGSRFLGPCCRATDDPVPAIDRREVGLVLLCHSDYPLGHAQGELRRMGLEPMNLDLVAIPAIPASDLPAALAGLWARLEHRPEVMAGQVRPSLVRRDEVSLRDLFSLRLGPSEVIPQVADHCVSEAGCDLCVSSCPEDALSLIGKDLALAPERCTACGLCTVACPIMALVQPPWLEGAWEAYVRRLVDAGAPAVVLACPHAVAIELPPGGWVPLEIPSVGVISVVGMLFALEAGLPQLVIRTCAGGCDSSLDQALERELRILETIAPQHADRVQVVSLHATITWDTPVPPDPVDLPDLAGMSRPARFAALVSRLPLPGRVPMEESPLGVVTFDPSGCTTCNACDLICPTHAIIQREEVGTVRVTFDANLCLGCGLCKQACPQASHIDFRVEGVIDQPSLAAGRVDLKIDEWVPCTRCGDPIASKAMLEHINAIMQDINPIVNKYCIKCRAGSPALAL